MVTNQTGYLYIWDFYYVYINFFQLEIGIPTISLVYLQDNQKYVHT